MFKGHCAEEVTIKRSSLGIGALAGALLTAPLMVVMYLADEVAGLPFIPFDLFDWAVRVLPGSVVTFGLDLMIDVLRLAGVSVAATAKTAERSLAVAQFFSVGVVAGALYFGVVRLRCYRPDRSTGVVIGALLGLPMIAISIAIGGSDVQPVLVVLWLTVLFLAWGVAVRESYVRLSPDEPASATVEEGDGSVQILGRRQFLVRFGAVTATITVAGSGIGNLMARAARNEIAAEIDASMAHLEAGSGRSPFPNSNDPLMPAPGTRPEYTPVKDHYEVSIRSRASEIDGATWSLPIIGLVKNPVSLTLDDIRDNYTPRDQYVTLACISGRVGSDLISTTQWTGVSLQEVLAEVEPDEKARYLFITCGDGFYETVALELIASDERIMLCYEWDGNSLPIDHGFPLRIWIPDRYGMKQPRWITGIEVIDEFKLGYWVERGWDNVAQIRATSVIDTVAAEAAYENNGQQMVPVGGIAFAGARGISKAEVRVNRGEWHEADLRAPLSETTWVIWRYDWPFEAGDHVFETRCLEGDGTSQIEEPSRNHPDGATGIHSKSVSL